MSGNGNRRCVKIRTRSLCSFLRLEDGTPSPTGLTLGRGCRRPPSMSSAPSPPPADCRRSACGEASRTDVNCIAFDPAELRRPRHLPDSSKLPSCSTALPVTGSPILRTVPSSILRVRNRPGVNGMAPGHESPLRPSPRAHARPSEPGDRTHTFSALLAPVPATAPRSPAPSVCPFTCVVKRFALAGRQRSPALCRPFDETNEKQRVMMIRARDVLADGACVLAPAAAAADIVGQTRRVSEDHTVHAPSRGRAPMSERIWIRLVGHRWQEPNPSFNGRDDGAASGRGRWLQLAGWPLRLRCRGDLSVSCVDGSIGCCDTHHWLASVRGRRSHRLRSPHPVLRARAHLG